MDVGTIKAIQRAVMRADKQFEQSGGSTRHWILECFLPELEREDLCIRPINPEEEVQDDDEDRTMPA